MFTRREGFEIGFGAHRAIVERGPSGQSGGEFRQGAYLTI
jgi:hypothetical protein